MLEPKVNTHKQFNRPQREVQHQRGCGQQPPQAVSRLNHGEAETQQKGHSKLHLVNSYWFLLLSIVSTLCLISANAHAAISLNGSIQVCDKSATTCATTHTGTNSGESVVMGCIWREAGGSESITGVTVGAQSASSTTLQTSAAVQHKQQWWYLGSLSSGGSKTVTATWNTSNVFGTCFSAVLAGADTAALIDDQQAATGNDTTPTVNLTATVSGDAIFILGSSAASTPTANTGYSLTSPELMDFWSYAAGAYDTDFDAGASGSKTASMTTSSGQWAINAIAVKAATGGGGGGNAPRAMHYKKLMAQ